MSVWWRRPRFLVFGMIMAVAMPFLVATAVTASGQRLAGSCELTTENTISAVTPTGTFCPDAVVTRAEMAGLIVRSWLIPGAAPSTPTFKDVPLDHWAFGYVETWQKAYGPFRCDSDSTRFCPDVPITRGEAAEWLAKVAGIRPYAGPESSFRDVAAGDPHRPYIEALYRQDLSVGCQGSMNRFCPDQSLTRSEAAASIARLKGWAPTYASVPSFSDVPQTYWAFGYIERLNAEGVPSGCALPASTAFAPAVEKAVFELPLWAAILVLGIAAALVSFRQDWAMLLLALGVALQQQEISIGFFHLSLVKIILWSSLLVWAVHIFRALISNPRRAYEEFAPPFLGILLVLGLLFIPSLFRSLSQAAWVKDFVRFGLGVGAFAFMYYWVRTRARDGKLQFVRRFLQWMVVGGVGSVLVLIWQYVNSGIASIRNVSMVNIYSYRQTSTFLDPNYYGEFLVTLLPLAIALALTEPKRWQRVTFGLLAAFLGLGIVLTFSRSALTAMTLAVLVFLIYFARSRQLTLVKVAPSVVGLVLLLSVTVSVILGIGWLRCRAWVVSQILLNRIVGITGTATSGSGVDQRVAILKSSLAMLRANVWVGAGLGNFERQFVFYQTGPTGGSYRDAHNTFIRLWAETGVFSFLAYIVFLVLSGWFVVQRLRRTRDAVWGLVSAALLAGWLGSLVASMFLDQLLEAYYWIYYGLMMGVAASVTREESEPLRQPDGKGERVSATRG